MNWIYFLRTARLSLLVWLVGALAAPAAELRLIPAGPGYMPGTRALSISGEITAPDVARVAELVDEMQRTNPGFEERIDMAILNSPGGNFQAGIDIARIFDRNSISTVVPENAECLSACAVIFMAGSYLSMGGEGGASRNRTLYLPARLGFHRPKIGSLMSNMSPNVLSQLSPEQLGAFFDERYNTAFNTANQMILDMLAVDPGAWNTDLVLKMLTAVDTADESNFIYPETVADIRNWDISVRNVRPPDLATAAQKFDAAFALCFNTGPYLPNGEDRFWALATDLDKEYAFNRDDVPRMYQNTRHPAGRWIEIYLYHEAPMGCRVTFEGSRAVVTLAIWGGEGPTQRYDLDSDAGRLGFYRPDTPLDDIADRPTPSGVAARCMVLDGNRVTDNDPCTRLTQRRDGGGRLHIFTWPSGSRTVVEDAPLRTLINGAAARSENGLPPGMVRCLRNSATGRTFCYGGG